MWGISVTPRPLFTPWKDPVPIVHEAGWAPGPVWTGAENLAPFGIRSPDRLALANRYTNWAIPVHSWKGCYSNLINLKVHKIRFDIYDFIIIQSDQRRFCVEQSRLSCGTKSTGRRLARQRLTALLAPRYKAKPETVNAVVSSLWWARRRPKHVEWHKTSSNKLVKLLHLVG